MPNTIEDQVVVAREAIVIVVGARPIRYARITVKDRRTQQVVEIDDTDGPPLDEGDVGTSYAFKEGQVVRADHVAVVACPAGFRPPEKIDSLLYPSQSGS